MESDRLLQEAERIRRSSRPGTPDWARALGLLEELVAGDPSALDGWQALGEMHLDAEEYPRAAEAFRQAVDLKPDDGLLRTSLARSLLRAGEAPAATLEFIEAVRRDPDRDPLPYVYLESAFRAADMQVGATWAEFRRREVARQHGREESQPLSQAEDHAFQKALAHLPPEEQATVRADLGKLAPGGREQGKPSGCLLLLLAVIARRFVSS